MSTHPAALLLLLLLAAVGVPLRAQAQLPPAAEAAAEPGPTFVVTYGGYQNHFRADDVISGLVRVGVPSHQTSAAAAAATVSAARRRPAAHLFRPL